MTSLAHLTRLDATRLRVANDQNIETNLFASAEVPIEREAVEELRQLLRLRQTVERLADALSDAFLGDPVIDRVAITPDFHKGAGVPVGTILSTRGFVVPQAIGNDVNCGMRLHVTSLDASVLTPHLDELEGVFRRLFFEAGRNIPMSRGQREALFRQGLQGLLDSVPRSQNDGLWSLFHEQNVARQLGQVERQGSLPAREVFGLADFLGPADRLSRDCQIGSIGGGNHFVEIQRVERILDGQLAHAWGLQPGQVTVMIHTGSVGVGHLCGGYYRDVLRRIYPATLPYPDNGIFVLPLGERYQVEAERFWDALHNAANFAFANRLFLGLMALSGLREVLGEVDFPLLYDAPHNLVWPEEDEAGAYFLHRKGATTARGMEAMAGTPFEFQGEPVLVPGSMGASSFVMVGQGNPDALDSASHGAGRALARGAAGHGHDAEFADFLRRFRVVTPIDLRRADIARRRDIVQKKLSELKQEAPHAYKGIGPIVHTLQEAGMARPVVELSPILTIKG